MRISEYSTNEKRISNIQLQWGSGSNYGYGEIVTSFCKTVSPTIRISGFLYKEIFSAA
jgi:hypothetical protein